MREGALELFLEELFFEALCSSASEVSLSSISGHSAPREIAVAVSKSDSDGSIERLTGSSSSLTVCSTLSWSLLIRLDGTWWCRESHSEWVNGGVIRFDMVVVKIKVKRWRDSQRNRKVILRMSSASKSVRCTAEEVTTHKQILGCNLPRLGVVSHKPQRHPATMPDWAVCDSDRSTLQANNSLLLKHDKHKAKRY